MTRVVFGASDPHQTPPAVETSNVIRDEAGGPYPCPCCGWTTLPTRGGYDLCPVCFWEDDGQDEHDAESVRNGPNGGLSLAQARANYASCGAVSPRFLKHVREPLPQERGDRS